MFLSHLHADHCLDLTGYYVLRRYHPDGHQPRIPVWGPIGTADRMARAYDLPPDPGMHEEFDFHVYDGPVGFGPFEVEPIEVEHPVPAFGLRVTADGRTLGYSGDTGPCAGLDAVAADVDLLLAEASFTSRVQQPREAPPHRRRGRRLRGPQWSPPARADPRPAVGRPARSPSPRPGRRTTETSSSRPRAPCSSGLVRPTAGRAGWGP